jgi:hypothetical protein
MGKVSLLTSQWFAVWYTQGAPMATNSLMKSLKSLNPEHHNVDMVEKYIESFKTIIENCPDFGEAERKLAKEQLTAFETHLAVIKKPEAPKSSDCPWEGSSEQKQEGDALMFERDLPNDLTEMLEAAKRSGIYMVSIEGIRWIYDEATKAWDPEYDP